jgi:hypothetical protein
MNRLNKILETNLSYVYLTQMFASTYWDKKHTEKGKCYYCHGNESQ